MLFQPLGSPCWAHRASTRKVRSTGISFGKTTFMSSCFGNKQRSTCVRNLWLIQLKERDESRYLWLASSGSGLPSSPSTGNLLHKLRGKKKRCLLIPMDYQSEQGSYWLPCALEGRTSPTDFTSSKYLLLSSCKLHVNLKVILSLSHYPDSEEHLPPFHVTPQQESPRGSTGTQGQWQCCCSYQG